MVGIWTRFAFMVILATIAMVAVLGTASGAPVSGWGAAVTIDDLDGTAGVPSISTNDDGSAVAAWTQKTEWYCHVYASMYSPSGNWSTPEKISDYYWDNAPQVSTFIDDEGDVLVVFGTESRFYSHGTGWGPEERFDNEVFRHALAANGNGSVVLVYPKYNYTIDGEQLRFKVYVKGSGWDDGGLVFQGAAAQIRHPMAGMDGEGRVIAAWTMGNLYAQSLCASRFDGKTWSDPATLSDPLFAESPSLAVGRNGDAIIAWGSWWGYWEGTRGVQARTYSSGAWGEPILVSSSLDVIIGRTSCAVDSAGNSWIVWDQMVGSMSHILCGHYVNGTGWEATVMIEDHGPSGALAPGILDGTYDVGDCLEPRIGIGLDGTVMATWYQLMDTDVWPYEYFVLTNQYSGPGWRGEERLGYGTFFEGGVAIAIDSEGRAFTAWSLENDVYACRYSRSAGPPSAPTQMTVEPHDRMVNLTWSEPFDDGGNEVTGYQVYRAEGSSFEKIASLPTSTLQFSDSSVSNGLIYSYTVSASNAAGEGPKCIELRVMPCGRPGAPGNITYSLDGWSLLISWSAPYDGGAPLQGYNIYRGSSVDSLELFSWLSSAAFTYWSDTLPPGSEWYYAVSAYNRYHEGPTSDIIFVHNAGPPSAPTNLTASAMISYNLIEWGPPEQSDSPIIEYRIYWSVGSSDLMFLGSVNSSTFQMSHFDVSDGVEYSYHATALSAVGASPMAGPVHVTADSPSFTITSPSMGDSWTCGDTHNITWTSKYGGPFVKLELGLPIDFDLVLTIADSTPNDGSFQWIIPNLAPGNAYKIGITDLSSPQVFGLSAEFEILQNASTAPITTVQLVGPQITPPYFVGPVTVSFTVTDPGGEGIDYTEYLIYGTWTRYTSPFLVESGSRNIYYRSVDLVGAIEPTKMCWLPIDLQDPVITVTSPAENEVVGAYVKLWASASDDFSGISSFAVSIDGGAWEYSEPSWYLPIEGGFSEGNHSAHYVARDNAGREITVDRHFTVILSPPMVLSVSPAISGISVMTNITVEFSRPMMVATILVEGLYGDDFNGDIPMCRWNGAILTITPDPPLDFGRTYNLTIFGSDHLGNTMESPYEWNFTTRCGFWGEVHDQDNVSQASVTIEVWQDDILITTVQANSSGVYKVECAPGNFTIKTLGGNGQKAIQNLQIGYGMANTLQTTVTPTTSPPDSSMPWIIMLAVALLAVSAIVIIFIRHRRRG